MKKNGFTIIESLIAVSLAAILGTTIISYQISTTEETKEKLFSQEMNSLINGIDQRISVDGYDFNLWSKSEWDNTTLNNLTNKQLQAINSSCGNGEWNPKNNEKDLKLVNCGLMEKLIYPLDINVKINKDAQGFIDKTVIDYNFKTNNDFKKYFPNFRKSFLYAKSKSNGAKTGTVFYQYIDKDTNNQLSVLECAAKETKCLFRTTLNRQGGGEYLKVDGSNSMIGSKIKFITAKGNDPLKCIRWDKNASSVWTKKTDEECGIGFYGDTPVIVETITKEATFENIKLNQLCNTYSWNGSNVVASANKTPCGMSENGGTLIQLIPNIHSSNGYFDKIYSNNAYLDVLNLDDLIANSINTKYLTVQKETKFNGDNVIFNNNNTEINSNVLTVNANSTTFTKNTKTKGNITGLGELTIEGFSSLQDTRLKYAHVTNNLEVDKSVIIKGVSKEGDDCSRLGEVRTDSKGALLTCIDNKFTISGGSTVPVGTVVIWSSYNIPEDWIEMNGQSTYSYPKLRAIVGNNVADLRGVFVRGLDRGRGIDRNRGLGSYQEQEIQSHSHNYYTIGGASISNGRSDPWSKSPSDNSGSRRTDSFGGNETRPKNVALIYIIKAK